MPDEFDLKCTTLISPYQFVKVPQHVHADEEPGEGAAHVRRVRDRVVTVAPSGGVPVVDGQGHVEGGDEERQGAAIQGQRWMTRYSCIFLVCLSIHIFL